MKTRYFIDLFAGCGGLSLGLEQAGFDPVLVNELNPDALETYLVNREMRYPFLRRKYNVMDVQELVVEGNAKLRWFVQQFRDDFGFDAMAGDLDLLVGGPPCQGFSRIGHRRTHFIDRQEVASNHLYKKMAQVIAFIKPRIFLFENVAGLQTAKWTPGGRKGEIWDDVVDTFASLTGYNIHAHVVHASYYDVPQNRPRVLIIGVRDDIKLDASGDRFANGFLPQPLGHSPTLDDLLSDLIDPEYVNGGETLHYPSAPKSRNQQCMRFNPTTKEVSQKGDPLTEHKYSRHSEKVTSRFQFMIDHGGLLGSDRQTKKFAQRVLPQGWGDRGPNITVTSLPDDYVHFAQPRTPTVREWARMQTFPDWYVFAGPRTTGSEKRAGHPANGLLRREVPKYTQIGNAVPVAMAQAIGNHFLSILDGEASPIDVLVSPLDNGANGQKEMR